MAKEIITIEEDVKLPKVAGEERSKIVRQEIDVDVVAFQNTKLSVTKRKQAYAKIMDKMLNPLPAEAFDPETWEPMAGDPDIELKKRGRAEPPKRLPTMGLKPKVVMEGQMIGMLETKQDLYLLIAWLSERVTDLEEQVEILSNK